MVIESLDLKNYRNYEYLNMIFDNKINIIYGDNAQGKLIFWTQYMYVRPQNPIAAIKIKKSSGLIMKRHI